MKLASCAIGKPLLVLVADSNLTHLHLLSSALRRLIEALSSVPRGRIINAKGEARLTPREEQVVSLVAEGMGNREVAQRLGIKENTVKKALLRIYDKLGVSNRVELVLYALTHRGVEKAPTLLASTPPATEFLKVAWRS